MNTARSHRLRFTTLLIGANAVFWLLFAINFAARSYTYHPHAKVFEEPSPPYIVFNRAFPFDKYMTPFMRTSRFLQWPSFKAVAKPYFWYFNNHNIDGDALYGGISVSGYYLLLVFVVSFLQWYAVGWLVERARKRTNLGPADGTSPPPLPVPH